MMFFMSRSQVASTIILRMHKIRCCLSSRPISTGIKPKLRIVFGSQSGTAESFANDLEFDAKDASIDAEIIDAKVNIFCCICISLNIHFFILI